MNKIFDGIKTLIVSLFTFGPVRMMKMSNRVDKILEEFHHEYGRHPTKDEWAFICQYDATAQEIKEIKTNLDRQRHG